MRLSFVRPDPYNIFIKEQSSLIFNPIGFDNIRGDTFDGVTAAVVAPIGPAIGVASGVGPETGLYGAVLVGLFVALFVQRQHSCHNRQAQ